jgi:para-aminobenzoate synthetase/4-amino-4-deoxychorismate lyase
MPPRLVFDFPAADGGAPRRLVYSAPRTVLSARQFEEVRPALAAAERALDEGLHVAGYVAYEAAPAFDPALRVRPGCALPLLWFGLFDGPEETAPPPGATNALSSSAFDWQLDVLPGEHAAAVAAVRDAIAEGLTYQVNLTARLRARLGDGASRDAGVLYETLRAAQGGGYAALLDLGRHVVASVSPELFFRVDAGRVTTRPMKGTRPRGRWPAEDEALARDLAGSAKDRAENVMIVDLLRNDLGRVCETGSVRSTDLFRVERYRTVWQLTSTVAGELRAGTGLTELLAALFPCGSVTGAPKVSTMEIIARLERSPRGVYCGAIGLVRPGGDAIFSVPIRTLWIDRHARRAEYGVGGGIVWDSDAADEHAELLAKARVLHTAAPPSALRETLACEQGHLPRRERHLERLRGSAEYWDIPLDVQAARRALARAAAECPAGRALVRLTLARGGAVRVESSALGTTGTAQPTPAPDRTRRTRPVALANAPVDSTDVLLFHKTTSRGVYEAARAAASAGLFDVLLHNERGEVTEFTRGNVVAELDGRRITPPLDCGLLPGCLREELLEKDLVAEGLLRVDDLPRVRRLWFVNSARGWIEVALPPAGAGVVST